ncbi:MAG: hypothetical protein ACYDAC_08320 [Candidatus Dormibacteria bacterium]
MELARRLLRAAGLVAVLLLSAANAPPVHASGTSAPAWSIAPSGDASGIDNRLYSVACADAATCWAVGTAFTANTYQTLIEQLTPSGWVVVSSPDDSSAKTTNGNEQNVLTSVSCVASGPCFAAGYWYDGQNQAHTLILESGAGGWQQMTSADTAPALVDDLLNSITCVSASDCWAVGESLVPGIFFIPFIPVPGTPAQTFAEHWDGTQWKIVPTPSNGANESVLESVACVSTSNCDAVGIDSTGSGTYAALIERWNGNSWSITGGADPSPQLDELDGAWCSGDGSCHATGIQRAPSATQTLTEMATASSGWVDDSGADSAPDRLNATTGITCVDDADCWAVGEYDSNGNFLFQTLIQQRTAAGWAVVPSPNVDTAQPDQLWGVSCAAATVCYAAGWSTDAKGVNHTLIEGLAEAPVQVPEMPPLLAVPAVGVAGLTLRRGRAGPRRLGADLARHHR